jgi:hypothetical protein
MIGTATGFSTDSFENRDEGGRESNLEKRIKNYQNKLKKRKELSLGDISVKLPQ